MEINTLEYFVAALWGAGVLAGLWLCLSARSVRSMLVFGASVVIPVLGSSVALVIAFGRWRALQQNRSRAAAPAK